MLAAQGGVCAICQNPCPTGRSLAVDHDHETGVVRALLCLGCNRDLGVFENFRTKAQTYLDQYGAGNPALANQPEDRTWLWRSGSDNALSKLTEEQVVAIRVRYAAGGVSQRTLADEFGISQISISRIVRRERWQHVA